MFPYYADGFLVILEINTEKLGEKHMSLPASKDLDALKTTSSH